MWVQSCQEVETQENPSLSSRRLSFCHWGASFPTDPSITREMRRWPGNRGGGGHLASFSHQPSFLQTPHIPDMVCCPLQCQVGFTKQIFLYKQEQVPRTAGLEFQSRRRVRLRHLSIRMSLGSPLSSLLTFSSWMELGKP